MALAAGWGRCTAIVPSHWRSAHGHWRTIQLRDFPHPRDDRFMQDWVAYGMLEMAVYLDRHARFADYCDRRDADLL